MKPKWRPGNQYFDNIISSKKTIDSKLAESKMRIFSAGDAVGDLAKRAEGVEEGDGFQRRERQRVGEKFFASDGEDSDGEESDGEDDE